MKVFTTQVLEPEGVSILEDVATVVSPPHRNPLIREEFLAGLSDADGVVLIWHTDQVDREAFERSPNLKVVARRGVGYDNIDLDEATRRGVYVTYCPVHVPTIADVAFGLIMCAGRRFPQADQFVRSGQWTEGGSWVAYKFMGYDIHHSTLGIIGLGRIGEAVAKRGLGFDMNILYYDAVRRPEVEAQLGITYAPLDELLAKSDFISINCSLNESTYRLINKDTLKLMKPSAVVVNTARGPIVDLDDLYEALKSGQIGGAGLDVFEPEPLPVDHPILKLDNVVFTPHLGASAMGMRVKMAETVASDVASVLRGEEPTYILNPAVKEVRPLRPRATP